MPLPRQEQFAYLPRMVCLCASKLRNNCEELERGSKSLHECD